MPDRLINLIIFKLFIIIYFGFSIALADEVEPDLTARANQLTAEGKYSEAEALYRQLLAAAQAQAASPHSEAIHAPLAFITLMQTLECGQEQAQHHYSAALEICDKAEQTNRQAQAMLQDAPDDDNRRKLLAMHAMALGQIYQQQSQIHVLEGENARLQSEYEKAEPLLKQGLALAQKAEALNQQHYPSVNQTPPPTGAFTITPMITLARFYQSQERYNEAALLIAQISQLLPQNPGYLTSLVDLYQGQQDFTAAAKLIQQGLNKLPPDDPQAATLLTQLANLRQNEGKYADAEQLWQQILSIEEKQSDQDFTYSALVGLALAYFEQKQYAKIPPLMEKAVAIRQQKLGQADRVIEPGVWEMELIGAKSTLASTYLYTGRYEEAKSLYLQNLANANNIFPPGNHASKAMSLRGLAKAQALQGDIPAALDSIHQSQALFAAHPSADREQAKEEQRLARSHLWLLQRGLANQQIKPDKALPEAFQALQQAYGKQRAQALRQTALRLSANDPLINQEVRELWRQQARLQTLDTQHVASMAQTGTEAVAATAGIAREKAQTAEKIQQLDAELQQNFPVYAQLINPLPLSLQQAQALLEPDEALLAWVLGDAENLRENYSYLFVLRASQKPHLYQLNVNQQLLRKLLETPQTGLLASLANPQQPFNLKLAHGLYQQLFAPAEADLAGIKHIIAVTDGPLQSLPLQTLVKTAPKDGDGYTEADWLARHYAFSYLPAVHSLAHLRTHQPSAGNQTKSSPFIGFGDPVLGARNQLASLFSGIGQHLTRGGGLDFLSTPVILRENLERLPDTADEIRAIAKLLDADPKTSIYLADKATETNLKRLSQQGDLSHFRTISFATHALLPDSGSDTSLPQRQEAGLVLTPPDKGSPEDDGYLSASEAAALNLNADWVLLSACNTATTEPSSNHDGLSQLAKSFFAAGARSVLASHWSVDSRSTSQLMTYLFTHLHEHPDIRRAEALRLGMLDLLETPAECNWLCKLGWQDNNSHAHPAYWAPFVVYGEGGTIK